MKTYLVSLALIIYLNQCVSRRYDRHRLFRAVPTNENQMAFLRNLDTHFHVNYWRYPGSLGMPIDFVISPVEEAALLFEVERRKIKLTTVMRDVQKAFDMQIVKSYVRSRTDSFDWNNYYRLNDIYQWLRDLNKEFPKEMSIRLIGKTHENRDIMAVKILHKRKARSKVFVEGGIHAREWIAPAFVTYLISQILHAGRSQDQALKTIAFTYEWYFVPVLNPDGYEYTHTEDRMWRKNRFNGHGIDINRNFAAEFGTVGISNDTKSEVYCGTKAFSERESKALADFVGAQRKGLEYYFSFHSFGQFMLIPYGYSTKYFENYDFVKHMCEKATTRIAARYNTNYTAGTTFETLGYLASGVSTGWVKKTYKVPYVVTFELRDRGDYGFALPPYQILPTCQETMDGMLSLLTPRTTDYRQQPPNYKQSAQRSLLDKIVIVWNVFLFIIVRFD